jgi:hypothetical protein
MIITVEPNLEIAARSHLLHFCSLNSFFPPNREYILTEQSFPGPLYGFKTGGKKMSGTPVS